MMHYFPLKKENLFIYLFLITPFYFAQTYKQEENQNVGNIKFDSNIDDPSFKVCFPDQTFTYYYFSDGLSYKGEKYEILKQWQLVDKSSINSNKSGYITVKFLVNCEGKTGLFRIQQMDDMYKEVFFEEDLVNTILNFVKKLDKWIVPEYSGKNTQYRGRKLEYYQYLTFKIENGIVKEILP